ncbi:MAG: hypothetical protein J6Y36_04700 [Treponema sp.]|nr:hypothetical protein [Treponema sp.]
MKKARRLFILFTLALLTAGCKKNIKSDIQAELTPESSTDSEYTTSDEESTAFVNNTELKAFYKVNGMPVETVYAVRDFKVETDDEKDVYIYREEMLKLVSINGSKAKVLAPVRECVKNRELFYINVDVNDITPDYLEKDFASFTRKDDITDYLDRFQWTGYFPPTRFYYDGNEIQGIMTFRSYYKGSVQFTFQSDAGTLNGTYYVSKDGEQTLLNIDIYKSDDTDFYSEADSATDSYQMMIFDFNEDSFYLQEGRGADPYLISLYFPYISLEDLENLWIGEQTAWALNQHECVSYYDRNIKNWFADSEMVHSYVYALAKLGICLKKAEYRKIYDNYWNGQFPASERGNINFDRTAERDYSLKYFSYQINPDVKTYEDVIKDMDSLKPFYRESGEMHLYGENIWCVNNVSDDRIKDELSVYEEPDEKSTVLYKTKHLDYFKIAGIGKKDTLYGVTSHWVKIIIPRFKWDSDEPKFGWVFGAALNFTEDLYPTNYSHSCIEEKEAPWDFYYDPLEITADNYDSLFSSKELYDVNENGETHYTRYLKFLKEKGRSLELDLYQQPYPDFQLEFIRSGVYPGAAHEKELKSEFKLDYLYTQMLQKQYSLYPVIIKDADNLINKKSDPTVKVDDTLSKFTVTVAKLNSFEFEGQYITNSALEHTSEVLNKATLYEMDDGSNLVMVYSVFKNDSYCAQDQINVYKIDNSKNVQRIYSWKSNCTDWLSETRARITFEGKTPVIKINKINVFSENENIEKKL